MQSSERRSGAIPIHHHPLVLPTLFVAGGWLLLLGGYLPGRTSPPPSPPLPERSARQGGADEPTETFESPPPTVVTLLDDRSTSTPLRLTIEFPNGRADAALITVTDPDLQANRAPEAASASQSAPVDAQTIQTRSAPVEAPLVPPPIPGPPPAFNPAILSPLIPESVPASPKDEGRTTADAMIARPMDELPDTFNPGDLLDRYRSDESSISAQGSAIADGAKPIADMADPLRVDQGDLAPDPPPTPHGLPPFSSAPVILPEPSSAANEAPQPLLEMPSAPTVPPVGPASHAPIEPIRQPPQPDRRGLRGLFRAFRPPPPIHLVPPPRMTVEPGHGPAEPISSIPDPVTPSDLLLQTDALFRSAPTLVPGPDTHRAPTPIDSPQTGAEIPPVPEPTTPTTAIEPPMDSVATPEPGHPPASSGAQTLRAPVRRLVLPLPSADEAIRRARGVGRDQPQETSIELE
ncbi:hypothetical protein [Tautonia rosea]|uniref:hypothetical protein n=1 Tax=Tautonia rosea TaxID=2728037 RepID=UPI001474C842|nr:hypothetical protein [Tautonia rosea]